VQARDRAPGPQHGLWQEARALPSAAYAAAEFQRDGPGGGSLPPRQVTVGCDPAVTRQVHFALHIAKSWVAAAISGLELFLLGAREPELTAVTTALRDNFHTVERDRVQEILDNFRVIRSGLGQQLDFYCTTACMPGDLLWVLRDPARFDLPPGIINVCPDFDGCDWRKQASGIIHERAHEVIGALDVVYEVEGNYDQLAPVSAIANADCYAAAARQIANLGLYGPGLSCTSVSTRARPLLLEEPTLRPPRARGPRLL
jgi:hypothetical protein